MRFHANSLHSPLKGSQTAHASPARLERPKDQYAFELSALQYHSCPAARCSSRATSPLIAESSWICVFVATRSAVKRSVLGVAPYGGFINPEMTAQRDEDGNFVSVEVTYPDDFTGQMLRYSEAFSFLPDVN